MTWIIVVADHGEGMGSHGEQLHGVLLYNATVRVPFIVRPPGGRAAPAFEHFPVSLVDVAPTVLSFAGLEGGADMDGMDLSPWLDPGKAGPLPPQDRAVYVESLYAFRHYGWAGQRAIVTADTKLIDSTTPELYQRDDYAETANRAGDDPAPGCCMTGPSTSRLGLRRREPPRAPSWTRTSSPSSRLLGT